METAAHRRPPALLVWSAGALAGVALLAAAGVTGPCALPRGDVIADWALDPGSVRPERLRPSLSRGLWIELSCEDPKWLSGHRIFWHLRPWRGIVEDFPGHPAP